MTQVMVAGNFFKLQGGIRVSAWVNDPEEYSFCTQEEVAVLRASCAIMGYEPDMIVAYSEEENQELVGMLLSLSNMRKGQINFGGCNTFFHDAGYGFYLQCTEDLTQGGAYWFAWRHEL